MACVQLDFYCKGKRGILNFLVVEIDFKIIQNKRKIKKK